MVQLMLKALILYTNQESLNFHPILKMHKIKKGELKPGVELPIRLITALQAPKNRIFQKIFIFLKMSSDFASNKPSTTCRHKV